MRTKIKNLIHHIWYRILTKDEIYISRQQFKADNQSRDMRYDYPLNTNSVVLDVGGYKGAWAQKIVDLYDPYIHIFEPVEIYYDHICDTFKDNPKVSVHKFGLDGTDKQLEITIDGDATSAYRGSGEVVSIAVRRASSVFDELKLGPVDLIKINNEGGEYGLLLDLLETGKAGTITDIQVQFHKFMDNSVQLRNTIREQLRPSHELTYDYPFFFENWRKK